WQDCFPVGFEIGLVSLEELGKKYPVWDLLKENNVEIINPLYAEPYLRHICEESNIRQFEFGLDVMEAHDLKSRVYATSEHALHPQIPQLLRGFGIEYAFASARLAGGAPTSYHPKLLWEGLDGTTIPAIASQSGLPNGHVWHGKLFEELPELIFAAVARPDLQQVVYVNIEDFANPMPGSGDVAKHIVEFERAKIYFRSFLNLAKSNLPVSRQVRWSIEDFPIRSMDSNLIHGARRCEDFLVQVEATDALLTALGSEPHETEINQAWKNLMIAQNHDAYVVPFTTPGMYSEFQGIPLAKAWDIEETIEERGLRLVKEATQLGEKVLDEITGLDRGAREGHCDMLEGVAALNMLWSRAEIMGGRVYELPTLGYSCAGEPSISSHNVRVEGQTIVYADHEFSIGDRAFTVVSDPGGMMIDAGRYTARLVDSGTRLEIFVNSMIPVEITFKIEKNLFITYPFGAEKSSESFGHTLRFAWLDEDLVVSHKGTPYFKRENGKFRLQVPAGEHSFALDKANTLLGAYQRAWEFFYPPILFKLKEGQPAAAQLCDLSFEGTIPTSIRSRYGKVFMRLLSVDGSLPHVHDASPVDFRGNLTEITPAAWRILNYILPLSVKPED
nr:hypothetical protein [Candidatus Sigynarchaeota archaeon]